MNPLPSLAPSRGISQSDVSHAADSLLRAGERPTNDKVRTKIGRGSLTTIGPLLDAWWKTLSARLDAGPAAFHRLPEVVAHVAESLWMHAQEEASRRTRAEHKTAELHNANKEQSLEVRSHVLTLREGELDSRLRNRDRTIEELKLSLRELSGALRKEQATGDSLFRQLADLQAAANRNPKRLRSARPAKRAKAKKRMRKPVRSAVKKRPPPRGRNRSR